MRERERERDSALAQTGWDEVILSRPSGTPRHFYMQQFARIRHGESIIPVLVAGNSVLDLRPIVPDITPETIASGALTRVDARGLATIQGDFSYLAPITGVRQVPA